jgi:hypothetical protein
VKAFILAAALFLSACGPTKPNPEPRPPSTECEAVCVRWAECDFGKPSPKGVSCQSVCEMNRPPEKSGWDVPCMLRATTTTCAEANRCTY